MGSKVLVIGLDGATFDIIEPMIKKGKLKNLKKLIDDGFSGRLFSLMPHTAPTWTSMFTGKNPGKHNIFDFYAIKPPEMNKVLLSSYDRKSETLWNMLSESGKRVCVIDVPMTYPPEKVNGIMISGMNAPLESKNYVNPKSFLPLLEKLGYKVLAESEDSEVYSEKAIEDRFKRSEKTACHFLENYEWDLFIAVFMILDHSAHHFWGTEKLEEYYEMADRMVGSLLKHAETVLVVSDHGTGELKRRFYVNKWLEKEGYLKLKGSGKLRVSLIRGMGRPIVKRLGLDKRDFVTKHTPKLDKFNIIKWDKTKAYASGNFAPIFLKDKSSRDSIIGRLMELEDNGKKVISKIYVKEDVFKGPYTSESPDLVLIAKDGYIPVHHMSNEVFSDADEHNGTHEQDGIFIVYGKEIKNGKMSSKAEYTDSSLLYRIAPTILHIFGLKIPRDMDGKPLKEIFKKGSKLSKRDVLYTDKTAYKKKEPVEKAYSKEDEERIKKRLQDLGYV